MGWSLGGYYSPRVGLREALRPVRRLGSQPQLGCRAAASARLRGRAPGAALLGPCQWVWGYDDLDEFIEFADSIHLDGVVEKITVPFLIVHGEIDRQIPLEYVHRSYEQAVNAPSRELRLFTAQEGVRSISGSTTSPSRYLHR